MTEDSKPVVTGADREAAWLFRPEGYGPHDKARWDAGAYDGNRVIQAFARHRAHSSPDEKPVVSQDLVPVGLDDCETAEDVAYYWRRQALEARGAIEAARNEALVSEKPCKNCGFLPEKAGQGGVGSTDLDPNQTACDGGKIG